MQEFFGNTVLPAVMWFVNTKPIRAIKDGLVYSIPLITVAAVSLLLFQLPVQSLADMVTATGFVPALRQGYTSSFQIVALIAALGIAYQWAKNDGYEPLSAGIIAIALFLIFIPSTVSVDLLDAEGNAVSYVAGLLTGIAYSWFLKRDIRIKMPDGVPDGVAAAFTGLIPAAAILTGGILIYHVCLLVSGGTPIELIYKFLQAPLQSLGDTFVGVAILEGLVPFLWWFGVHGATVVNSVADPIATSNMLINQEIFDKLTAEGMTRAQAIAAMGANGAHIFTNPWRTCFHAITGSGITIGMVIYMVFFAKSEQFKTVGKLGVGCGIFNINEPILFGTPIVMNPKLFIPFVLAPLFSNLSAYVMTAIGFIPYTTGVTVPWTTPPIISGFICCGWQGALWQVVCLAASFFIYLPFARSVDNELYEAEQAAA